MWLLITIDFGWGTDPNGTVNSSRAIHRDGERGRSPPEHPSMSKYQNEIGVYSILHGVGKHAERRSSCEAASQRQYNKEDKNCDKTGTVKMRVYILLIAVYFAFLYELLLWLYNKLTINRRRRNVAI